jgi:RNA polymerase sigma factor (sigma-70 family)
LQDLGQPEFLRKLIAGDVQAFNKLVSLMLPHLRGFISRNSGFNEPDCDELASDVLFKIYKGINKYKQNEDAKITTWIFEIAKNTVIDEIRRRARQQEQLSKDLNFKTVELVPLSEKHEASAEDSQPNLFDSEQEKRDKGQSPKSLLCRRAYDSLSESDKDILRMTYIEISKIENSSESNLRVRHKRAKDRLYKVYEKEANNER